MNNNSKQANSNNQTTTSNNKQDTSSFQNHLRQLFNDCDIDQNGFLTRQEFRHLCSKIGFTQEAAEETFKRLDRDQDDHISFEEFFAGFNQYRSATVNHHSAQSNNQDSSTYNANHRLQAPSDSGPRSPSARLSPVASRAAIHRPNTSNITLGSNVPARFHASATAAAGESHYYATSATSSAATTGSANSEHLNLTSTSSAESNNSASPFYRNTSQNKLKQEQSELLYGNENMLDNQNVVIYSSDLLTNQIEPSLTATGGSQYNSLLSQSGGLAGASGSSLTQTSCLNVQDLLECVQKLQNENQQLSQIFFKDKRQRDELISQLGEEFDQQVKEVEERANKRARDELEAEKRRLRDMMLEEREQLQHHYKTIERMSNLVKNVYEERKRKNSDGLKDGSLGGQGSSIDLVKSQLEDTYEENKQLKRSLLDTKTDVARIWKEMGNLKEKYEEQLSSAYERNEETKTECDHIKRQLNLMKDSNRKLQDASDVITSYITDKVEPVIKIATVGASELPNEFDNHVDNHRLSSNGKLLMVGSASNSRRGSVLSDYLGTMNDEDDEEDDDNDTDDKQQDREHDKHVSSSIEHQTAAKQIGQAAEPPATSSRNVLVESSATQQQQQQAERSDDDRDIKNWLAQPHQEPAALGPRSNSPAEPRSAAILRRARLSRDGLRASESSSNSSEAPPGGAPTNNADNNDLQRSVGTNKQKTSSRRPLKQQSHSIDLQSDEEEEAAPRNGRAEILSPSDKRNKNKSTRPDATGNNKQAVVVESTAAATVVNDVEEASSRPVSMVEAADGPPVATYDIILVGDSFVGKSSLASRFIEGSYSRSVISTTSIDFKTKDCKVDGVNYTINLWDTAGQERFRSITASYFRKAKGIILMYDVTEKHTYLNIRNWMSTISNSASESVAVLLLANKIDLRQAKGPENCVPSEEGERLAAEYGILFLETSVKSGTNLDSSMANLIRQMVENCAPRANEALDSDRIKLHSGSRSSCMPKHC